MIIAMTDTCACCGLPFLPGEEPWKRYEPQGWVPVHGGTLICVARLRAEVERLGLDRADLVAENWNLRDIAEDAVAELAAERERAAGLYKALSDAKEVIGKLPQNPTRTAVWLTKALVSVDNALAQPPVSETSIDQALRKTREAIAKQPHHVRSHLQGRFKVDDGETGGEA